ncbi:MAG: 50S ribosomal protein L6 [Alphaproteobacteria bacterium]|nr:50S ribosomal protein L6 [Alphaproteobacteria bacterium]
MSRVGKHPIPIPDGVAVTVEGLRVTVEGKLGTLSQTFPTSVEIRHANQAIEVVPRSTSDDSRAAWGMTRALIANMVTGVSAGFKRFLDIEGVGYRAAFKEGILNLQLGYSHDVHIAVPDDLTVACPRPTEIEISGASRQRVGQLAAEIRAFRPPEPYKGKGVRHRGEFVRRKEGKRK